MNEMQALQAGMGYSVTYHGEGRWSSAGVVDVYAYMEERGRGAARDILAGVEESDEQVDLCWGCVPWLKDIDGEAWDLAVDVAEGGGQAFGVTEAANGDLVNVLFVAVSSRAALRGRRLVLDLCSVCVGDLEGVWWEGFEAVASEAGWYVEGDEGDGSQGSSAWRFDRFLRAAGSLPSVASVLNPEKGGVVNT